MRKEVTYINPLRLGVIYAAVLAAIYLVFGVIGILFGLMGGMHGGFGGFGMFGGGGLIATAAGILAGAIMGFLGGAISALVYNLAAKAFGGVVIELKDV
ncbi:MAG TPA: hypothetical protein VLA52_03350 [Thermohalobaculum sp.]|nr:hypothetical protein [Thermohalobaculum sp.]